VKAAVYYPWVYVKGGAERMLVEMIRRSRHDWTLYTNHFEPDATFPELRDVRVVRLPEISVRRNIVQVARAGMTLLTQSLELDGSSSLFVVSEGLGNLLAIRARVPTSCICLTPLKVAYDRVTRDAFFHNRFRPHYRIAFELYKAFERPAWKRYRRIFCNSEEVKRRLLEARLVENERVEVAYHGVDADRFRHDGRRELFFLVPGRIMWQKNIQLAIRAWLRFKPDPNDNDYRLVIAGMVDMKSRPYLTQMRNEARGRDDIVFVESPSDSELLDLYQRCSAVVFPSLNEDWGLVALEAMACGKAVIAINRGGPRESVIHGQTGFLCDDDPRAFTRALHTVAQMPEPQLDVIATSARERALRFSWSSFVDRIDGHVNELAGIEEAEVATARAVSTVGS
jgi:glycosyltransferase involved in cell wall biosynthesis